VSRFKINYIQGERRVTVYIRKRMHRVSAGEGRQRSRSRSNERWRISHAKQGILPSPGQWRRKKKIIVGAGGVDRKENIVCRRGERIGILENAAHVCAALGREKKRGGIIPMFKWEETI
jgi:hypothetical protein